ncbi:MAG: sugar phosphate isomerase/epimerase [Oscillibacter sp.]|nr:sugar phosphate isomerase/epimerase [Oscillibacter sp.]
MKLGLVTDSLADRSLAEAAAVCRGLGLEQVELGCGNWSPAPHVDLKRLTADAGARHRLLDTLGENGLTISALNCSGNPLAFQKDWEVTEKTFRLAKLLGVEKIVMMSGLPAGCPGDKTPVWITTSWPPETQDILDYQWNEVAIPKWKELVRMAEDCGIRQIALENHGMQLVYNPETLFRLREAVGPMVGMNLDPSHLFWMGGDPIEAARVLGEQGALYHVHGKDSRPERRMVGPNGLLDTKTIDQFRTRSWNYVAVGCGHGSQWWKEFFSTVRMAGYDGDVSLEMEDLTMPMLEGHLTSLRVLKEALVL